MSSPFERISGKRSFLINQVNHINGLLGQCASIAARDAAPDQDDPESEQMRWPSRNVYEAITGFIGCAAEGFGLRGAFYEFHYLPVLQAFRSAVTRGADVRLLHEAQEYKNVNEQTIAAARASPRLRRRAAHDVLPICDRQFLNVCNRKTLHNQGLASGCAGW